MNRAMAKQRPRLPSRLPQRTSARPCGRWWRIMPWTHLRSKPPAREKESPRVNAFIEGDDVVYHNYVHLGIAVSTDRGLAVPVMRNAEQLSFARVEQEVKRLATATRDGKLSVEELSGGTFTITNGGIF